MSVLIPWAPPTVAVLNLRIAEIAKMAIGICEDPPGSNRGPEIDEYNRRAGVDAGSYWCASAFGAWWLDAAKVVGANLEVPHGYASCDNWMNWAIKTNRWFQKPVIGAAVVYGVPGDASHIGAVVRTSPGLFSVEGNTTLDGYSRNGELVTLKAVNSPRVLGFVYPII